MCVCPLVFQKGHFPFTTTSNPVSVYWEIRNSIYRFAVVALFHYYGVLDLHACNKPLICLCVCVCVCVCVVCVCVCVLGRKDSGAPPIRERSH